MVNKSLESKKILMVKPIIKNPAHGLNVFAFSKIQVF